MFDGDGGTWICVTGVVVGLRGAHGRVDGADSSFFDRINRILQDLKHMRSVLGNPVESC